MRRYDGGRTSAGFDSSEEVTHMKHYFRPLSRAVMTDRMLRELDAPIKRALRPSKLDRDPA